MSTKITVEERERDWAEWQAVTDLLIKVSDTHSATLVFRVMRAGSGYRSFVDVELVSTTPTLTGPGQPLRMSLLRHYPHPRCTSIAQLMIEMLRLMDKRIGAECYRQRELPLNPPTT